MLLTLIVLVALMIPLVALFLDSQVGRALANRLENANRPISDAAEQRIGMLEAEVERLGQEVNRLRQESDFVHRLLEQRPDARGLPPGDPPQESP